MQRDTRTVEYFAGPVDGRQEQAPVHVDGMPAWMRIVVVPARCDSLLDERPTIPQEVHLYNRAGTTPVITGDLEVWQYTWGGPMH